MQSILLNRPLATLCTRLEWLIPLDSQPIPVQSTRTDRNVKTSVKLAEPGLAEPGLAEPGLAEPGLAVTKPDPGNSEYPL